MSSFRVKRKYDAAFNMINSFRELLSDSAAEGHLRCVSRGLIEGGVYVLGVHLTPTAGEPIGREEWSARRGNLAVICTMWSQQVDLRRRNERLGIEFDAYTPTRHVRIVDTMNYRTYTARQMNSLLARISDLEVVETYDFSYDMRSPVKIGPETEDVVFVLRKRTSPSRRGARR